MDSLAKSRNSMLRRLHVGLMAVLLGTLGGCGGGGGGGSTMGIPTLPAPVVVASYSVGGTIEGIFETDTVVLRNNGQGDLTLSSNGSFAFTEQIVGGNPYAVSIAQQPRASTCRVVNGQGTVNSQVADVRVVCAARAYTVGISVSGLAGEVVLENNASETLTLSSDGSFVFQTPVDFGAAYAVTVKVQPRGQTCSVGKGAGTAGPEPIEKVIVVCSGTTHTVGGVLSGLAGSVVLQNNAGDALTLSADGNFTFPVPIAFGGAYAVTVSAQPADQTCSVADGSGTVGPANVTSVKVVCATTTYTVGGAIAGLLGTLVLQNNAGDTLNASVNGPFTFAAPVAVGSTYNVTVLVQPNLQTCTVVNGSGTVATGNVVNLAVLCTQNVTTLSVNPTVVIPISEGFSALTVTNTGIFFATNVRAALPSGWTAVTQDASACASLAPGASCNLQFSSMQPYVAQGNASIQGDNTPASNATFGFSLGGFLVFEVQSASRVTVIDNADLAGTSWGGSGIAIGAFSFTDGQGNTNSIVDALGRNSPSAALQCAMNTSGGGLSWYLPAICQLSAGRPECPGGLANIQSNLINVGLGGFDSTLRWSSTENVYDARSSAFQHLPGALTVVASKNSIQGLRCIASVER